jgi:acyl-coenzyme A synthetase/AMP-(fatty) acid ligase/acyl carrier protein
MLFTFGFNGGNHEIYSALLNGASLHVYDVKQEGVERLPAWLAGERISVYCSAPTLFRHMVRHLNGEQRFTDLRVIKLIGEPVYCRDVEAYKKYFPDHCILVNRLGATEIGTSRWYFIDKATEIDGNFVPVGYAVEDNEVLLLNESRERLGFNEVGEIAVRSRYISPGYWRRPEKTAAVFLPDPEGGDRRIYLTGDLGVLRPDGCLVHVGRKDFQVKIRGHRVELAETEKALLDSGLAKDAAVIARSDPGGEQYLAAYVVATADPPPTSSALRRVLATTLPDFLIPSVFVQLDALPLTTSGKIDRRALPEPLARRPNLDQEFVPPRNKLEETLSGIWSEVLGVAPVGIHDNFFELGGHSLRATQVAARLHKVLRIEAPLEAIFQSPTIAELAARLESDR